MPNIHNLLLPKKTEKSIREGYDEDHEQVESDANLFDGSLDVLEFGPLIPTESERSLMERVRQELKHELKQCYKEKIVDIREEILRKRRAGKLPGDVTSVSKWPYPTYVRLYNVESSSLSLELYSEAALLDCCFEDESTSYTSGSDGCIRRYDLNAGTVGTIGRHDDIATSIVYSYEKGEVISTGLDEKIKFWVTRQREGLVFSTDAGAAVGCITVSGNNLVVCVEAAMHIYDLRTLDRNLDQPFQSYASQVAVPIRCVTSVPYSVIPEGMQLGQ